MSSSRSSEQIKDCAPVNMDDEGSNVPRLNMNHGFIKSIVRNQIDRDEYDKLISKKNTTQQCRHPEKPRKTCDPQLLYIPPHLRGIGDRNSKNGKENPGTADEKAAMRKEIRRRLMEQMAKEEHERLQVSEAVIVDAASIKKDSSRKEHLHAVPAATTSIRNEPLFKLNIRDRDGEFVEQIIYANDNSARVAKALSRKLELTDDQCRLLRNRIEMELEKRLRP